MPTSPLPGVPETPDPIFGILFGLGLCLAAYLLGSIPFGLLLGKGFGLGDIRKTGSGNIGATNVLRAGNKPLALAVLLLDGGKGVLAVLAGRAMNIDEALPVLLGMCAVMGHVFPVWLKFRGGKGVATSLGVMTALHWPIGLCMMAAWLVMAALFRYSSFSALCAFAAAPVLAWYFGKDILIMPALALAALIALMHRENIRRLLARTETKIGQKAQ